MADLASRADVARLLNRVAFGATAADFDRWVGQPYSDLVDFVLTPASAGTTPNELERMILENTGRQNVSPYLVTTAQQWWLERMRTAAWPLEEHMTLLWHNHFATAVRDEFNPDLAMVLTQNQTLRAHALGNFRALVVNLTVDPAMLFWLNGAQNATPEPNENYGRELLELFTLGKRPQVYTEQDVRESARVLTGWTCNPYTYGVAFDATRHDTDIKRVLGRTITNLGDTEYVTLIDTALAQPAASQFVAWKMVAGLAYVPTPNDVAVDPLVRDVAVELARHWDISAAVRVLLLHPRFRGGDAAQSQRLVRQPAEVVAASCKALGISADDSNAAYYCQQMGQALLRPPNVGGWPMGARWLSPATTLARYGWAYIAWALWTRSPLNPALPDPNDLGAWANRLGVDAWSPATEQAVRNFLAARSTAPVSELQAGVFTLLVASPDWMVI